MNKINGEKLLGLTISMGEMLGKKLMKENLMQKMLGRWKKK
jgi:hypothetical protein